MGSLLVVNSSEKAEYYAWIDVIASSRPFSISFAGMDGMKYVIGSATTGLTLDAANNLRHGFVNVTGTTASTGIDKGGVMMNVDSSNPYMPNNTYDFARMTVFSVNVDMAFNYDRGINDGSDGINIRYNGSDNTEYHAPEIRNNAPATGENWLSPNGSNNNATVLYVKDKDVKVDNRFVMSPAIPGGITLKLQADATGVAIGGLKETSVTFGANGISSGGKGVAGVAGFIEFAANAKTAAAVNKETSAFDWKVTKIKDKTTGTGKALTTTPVTFYTVLDVPKDPWDPSDTTSLAGYPYPPEDNKMQPWVTVLETMTSTAWCGGKTTVEQAAAAITTNLYEGGKFRYEPKGAVVYQIYKTSAPYFNLTSFHNQLTHPNPSPVTVGCADMAWGVKILSNLLGDNLKVMEIGLPTTTFNTNSIIAIGTTTPTIMLGWGYHAVAWRGADADSGTVYDACLKVYDAINSSWVLPINMEFTKYRTLLTSDPIGRKRVNNDLHRLD